MGNLKCEDGDSAAVPAWGGGGGGGVGRIEGFGLCSKVSCELGRPNFENYLC